jgi:DNA gyrase inhibitor GyrI
LPERIEIEIAPPLEAFVLRSGLPNVGQRVDANVPILSSPDAPRYRTFGFNNPDPSPGSTNYGYEIWLVVDPDVEALPSVEAKRVEAGKYAVTRCVGLARIGERWRALSAWVEESPYQRPAHGCRCLEEPLSPGEPDRAKWVFDLYLEIAP